MLFEGEFRGEINGSETILNFFFISAFLYRYRAYFCRAFFKG